MAVEEQAAAKINLTLHVTGRREDGYHLLDSLVVFAEIGDRISAAPAERLSLKVTGPMGAGLAGEGDNLCLRAARLLAPANGAAIVLEKHLPVASGIGGGSSDAAATIRALCTLWSMPLPDADTLAPLGADVPVCLDQRATRMQGIGELLAPVTLPPLACVLVNPGVAVPTPRVFAGLERADNPPMPDMMPAFDDAAACIDWLADQRNDLAAPAIAATPEIAVVLAALQALPTCRLARMSGSGATCFALFDSMAHAREAAAQLSKEHEDWWVRETRLNAV